MSVKSTFNCSRCGEAAEIDIYSNINVIRDPQLREKVKDGSLFTWECPHCGTLNLAVYPTIYHDPDSKLMLWLMPPGVLDVSQKETVEESMKAVSESLKNDPTMDGYVLRRVESVGDLIEKVNIHDANLDDIVVEMCKYITKMELGDDVAANAPMKFFRMEGSDNEMVFTYPKNGAMQGLRVGFNVYEDCRGILSRNPSVRPEFGFAIVDANWLAARMG